MGARAYRQLPPAARRAGLPAIGFELEHGGLEVAADSAGMKVRCTERDSDGRAIGDIEVSVFSAPMVIDADGLLEAKASDLSGGAHAVPITLPGASGYRCESRDEGPLPYRFVFALAPEGAAFDGGLVVTVRCKRLDWPAATTVLDSLRIITRQGTLPANDTGPLPVLPLAIKRPPGT